jgi:superfamily I DNA and/or RNA helicase
LSLLSLSLFQEANDTPVLQVGELLCDWRRVNVAFTRAKKKLIIIGSLSTLENNHLFSVFLRLLRDQNWVRAAAVLSLSLSPSCGSR